MCGAYIGLSATNGVMPELVDEAREQYKAEVAKEIAAFDAMIERKLQPTPALTDEPAVRSWVRSQLKAVWGRK